MKKTVHQPLPVVRPGNWRTLAAHGMRSAVTTSEQAVVYSEGYRQKPTTNFQPNAKNKQKPSFSYP